MIAKISILKNDGNSYLFQVEDDKGFSIPSYVGLVLFGNNGHFWGRSDSLMADINEFLRSSEELNKVFHGYEGMCLIEKL